MGKQGSNAQRRRVLCRYRAMRADRHSQQVQLARQAVLIGEMWDRIDQVSSALWDANVANERLLARVSGLLARQQRRTHLWIVGNEGA